MSALSLYKDGIIVREDPKKFNAAGLVELRQLFEAAIKEDPGFSYAYAELSYCSLRLSQQGWTNDFDATLKRAEELANKAIDLKKAREDKDDFHGHWSLAMVKWNQGRFDESFTEYDIAQDLDPAIDGIDIPDFVEELQCDLIADRGEALIYAGKHDEAKTKIDAAYERRLGGGLEIPHWYPWNFARLRYMTGDYQDAIDLLADRVAEPNDVLLITAASKAQLGDLDSAMTYMAQFSNNDPSWSIAKAAERHFGRDIDRQRWLNGLREAGLKLV